MLDVEVQQLSIEEIEDKSIQNWPIWEKEVSEFPWYYQEDEACFILEGEIEVITTDKILYIKPGDYVLFPRGLACHWNIKKPVKKHYRFFDN